uniref:Uncharacterized protein n=1 Tax=Rhizophora mucronata TaxID=61149 RepID=A0A2P2QWS8_RHIMU
MNRYCNFPVRYHSNRIVESTIK